MQFDSHLSRWWFQRFFMIFYVHPYLGKIPILTHICQMGWNHQLVTYCFITLWLTSRIAAPQHWLTLDELLVRTFESTWCINTFTVKGHIEATVCLCHLESRWRSPLLLVYKWPPRNRLSRLLETIAALFFPWVGTSSLSFTIGGRYTYMYICYIYPLHIQIYCSIFFEPWDDTTLERSFVLWFSDPSVRMSWHGWRTDLLIQLATK